MTREVPSAWEKQKVTALVEIPCFLSLSSKSKERIAGFEAADEQSSDGN